MVPSGKRGKGGGLKGPNKSNGPVAATLTKISTYRPSPYTLSSHFKPTINPISMAPTLSDSSPKPTTRYCGGFPVPTPSPLGLFLMMLREKFSSQKKGNHIGRKLGDKAGDEDKRTWNLITLWKKSTNRTMGPRSFVEVQQGPHLRAGGGHDAMKL